MVRRVRPFVAVLIAVALLAALPATARAQERLQPHAGSVAIGADMGFWIPDEHFNFSFTPNGQLEIYITHNLSVRGMVGWTRTTFVDQTRDLDQWRGLASLAWNWESGLWHPFILGGVGLVSVQYMTGDGDPVGSRIRQRTIHGAAGVEYFAKPKVTLKFEIRYDWSRPIPDIEASPSGLALSVGVKKYF